MVFTCPPSLSVPYFLFNPLSLLLIPLKTHTARSCVRISILPRSHPFPPPYFPFFSFCTIWLHPFFTLNFTLHTQRAKYMCSLFSPICVVCCAVRVHKLACSSVQICRKAQCVCIFESPTIKRKSKPVSEALCCSLAHHGANNKPVNPQGDITDAPAEEACATPFPLSRSDLPLWILHINMGERLL